MARTPSRSSRRSRAARRFSLLELAIGLALVGSLLAIVMPSFAREIHASRTVEPVDGLHRIGAAAVAYAHDHAVAEAFPRTASLTPPAVPRGKCEADPPALWDQPTWRALDFTPAPVGSPHCFAFSFDSSLSAARSAFRAQAHGDLDGDGVASTFEITGHDVAGDPTGPAVDPGMYIDSEIE
jgi:type IV pilus assembly protein PilA